MHRYTQDLEGPGPSNHLKKAVILIHGALMDASVWDNFAIPNNPEFKFIRPNLKGHGTEVFFDFNRADLPKLTPRFLACELLDNLLASERSELLDQSIRLVGHSLGGLVAIELHELLMAHQISVSQVIVGDSPIYLNGNTPAALSAKNELNKSRLGSNLLENSFLYFEAHACKPGNSYYETKLLEVCNLTKVTFLIGERGPFQRDNKSWDCGSFLGVEERVYLKQLSKCKNLQVETLPLAGHFVFHDVEGKKITLKLLNN